MPEAITLDANVLQQWVNAKMEPQAVEQELVTRGFDQETISIHLKAFRKIRNARKQAKGFIYMAIGAFLGFISCVLSLINPVPSLYEVILYGLTSLAILVIMLGLYFAFE